MAKLKAPLLSLGASGAIGKALVFFNWKGLDVVREYVIPSNPKSDDQITQRGFLIEAVSRIHLAEALAADELDAADKIAYALYGSIFATPRTWFNTIVKNMVDCRVAGNSPCILCNGELSVSTPAEITFTGKLYTPLTEEGDVYWGVSKTNMPHSLIANSAAGDIDATASVTIKGTRYYFQWRARDTSSIAGMRSGIYHAVST
ncbi:hypothetical protein ES703_53681 [subsurface metagenome]